MDLRNVAFIEVDLAQVHKRIQLKKELKIIFNQIKISRTKWNRLEVKPSTVASVIGVSKCDLSWFRLHPKDWVRFRQPRKVHSLIRIGPTLWKVLRDIEEHH